MKCHANKKKENEYILQTHRIENKLLIINGLHGLPFPPAFPE